MQPLLAESRRFLGYALAGIAATGSHYATMVVLVWALGGHEVAASSIGFVVGALVKYPLNYWLVFGSRQRHAVAVTRFVLALAIAFLLNAAILALLLKALDVHYMVSQVLTTGLVLFASYVMARLWIFRLAPAPGRAGDRR